MPTIRVTQAPRLVVVFGEEERGVGAVRCVFVEELVDRAQEALRLIQGNGALAAQIRLQIGHQESGALTRSAAVRRLYSLLHFLLSRARPGQRRGSSHTLILSTFPYLLPLHPPRTVHCTCPPH